MLSRGGDAVVPQRAYATGSRPPRHPRYTRASTFTARLPRDARDDYTFQRTTRSCGVVALRALVRPVRLPLADEVGPPPDHDVSTDRTLNFSC